MNLISKRTAAVLLCVLLAAVVMVAQAMPPHGRHGMGHGFAGDLFFFERMAERLDLSDEQRDQFEALRHDQREAARPLVRTLVAGRKALREASHGVQFDEAAVRAIAEGQAQAMIEMTVLKARGRHAMHAMLTPEQRRKLHRHHKRHGRDYDRDHDQGQDDSHY